MMWYDGGGMQWWSWLLGAFMMVAFWGLIIWGIWHLVTGSTRNDTRPAASAGAKEILDLRLARGEIDAGEYDRLRMLMDTPAAEQASSYPHKDSVTTFS
jgi:putative membrane protein